MTTNATTNEQTARHYIARIAAHADDFVGRDRAMAAMHIQDGLSQAEVARRLGVSESTVNIAVKVHGPAVRAAMAAGDVGRLAQAG